MHKYTVTSHLQQNLVFSLAFSSFSDPFSELVDCHIVVFIPHYTGNVTDDSPVRCDPRADGKPLREHVQGGLLRHVGSQSAGNLRQAKSHSVAEQPQADIQRCDARGTRLGILIKPTLGRDGTESRVDGLLGSAVTAIRLAVELKRRHDVR